MNTENLKVGDLLEAIDVCEMRETGYYALKISKLYEITEITDTHIIIKSELDNAHLFPKNGLDLFFRLAKKETMTIKEKTNLLKALAKVVKATEKNNGCDGVYDLRMQATKQIQEILKTINVY